MMSLIYYEFQCKLAKSVCRQRLYRYFTTRNKFSVCEKQILITPRVIQMTRVNENREPCEPWILRSEKISKPKSDLNYASQPKKKSKLKQCLYGCFPPPLCSFSGISVVSFFNENFEHGFARLTLVRAVRRKNTFINFT